ncbi:MAG: sugar nucleotide-binding protein, partial [Acetobacteraceae bacterium]
MSEGPIWITGAGGLIGHHLVQMAPTAVSRSRFVALTRDRLDLADFQRVREEFRKARPSLVVHCAALS